MGGTRHLIFLAGVIVLVFGILWAGQGSGTIPYPATSPMIGQSQWVYYGLLMILLGLGAIWYSRRK